MDFYISLEGRLIVSRCSGESFCYRQHMERDSAGRQPPGHLVIAQVRPNTVNTKKLIVSIGLCSTDVLILL